MITYIIWKHEYNRYVNGHYEVVGIFSGTPDEANKLIEELDAHDESVIEGLNGKKLYGHFKTEPDVITSGNKWKFFNV